MILAFPSAVLGPVLLPQWFAQRPIISAYLPPGSPRSGYRPLGIASKFENAVCPVDLILDTVGGETRERSYSILKSGGTLVSLVSADPVSDRPDARSVFFYVEVTTERLNGISKLLDSRRLAPQLGTLLPLNEVRTAHEMLAGAPHRRGKIVLEINR